MVVRGIVRSQNACPRREESGLFIGRLPAGRHSLRSEASITNPRYAAVKLGPNSKREGTALPLPLAGEGWGGLGGWGGGITASHPHRIAMRPPPQAGEVQRVCRWTELTQLHDAL